MKIWQIIAICVLFCCGLAKAQYYQPVQNDVEVVVSDEEESLSKNQAAEKPKLEEETVRFAKRYKDLEIANIWLKQEFSRNPDKNIVVSPLSFYLTSIVVANGVVDETLLEFSNLFSVLHLSDVGYQLSKYLYREKDSVFINLSLWGKAFSERYQKMMSEQFNAEVWGIKESTSPINKWVSSRTNGVIKKIAPEREVSEKELYVGLVSYFKGKLLLGSYNLTKEKFKGANDEVSMIHTQIEADYYEDDIMQAIRLPCEQSDRLTILLPKKEVGFGEFIEEMDVYHLVPAFNERAKIDVIIPLLNFDYNAVSVKNVFDALNIQRIFLPENYGFAKMVNFDEDVYLKGLFMMTKIDVGGAGGPNLKEESAQTQHNFIANRPFVFVINHGDFIGAFVRGN